MAKVMIFTCIGTFAALMKLTLHETYYQNWYDMILWNALHDHRYIVHVHAYIAS